MSKKKTTNYKQTLDKPMQKMQSYLYVDNDVMEYLRKFEHILCELSKDVAIIKSEITEINKILKERRDALSFVPNNHNSWRRRNNKNSYNRVLDNPITSKLSSNGK